MLLFEWSTFRYTSNSESKCKIINSQLYCLVSQKLPCVLVIIWSQGMTMLFGYYCKAWLIILGFWDQEAEINKFEICEAYNLPSPPFLQLNCLLSKIFFSILFFSIISLHYNSLTAYLKMLSIQNHICQRKKVLKNLKWDTSIKPCNLVLQQENLRNFVCDSFNLSLLSSSLINDQNSEFVVLNREVYAF